MNRFLIAVAAISIMAAGCGRKAKSEVADEQTISTPAEMLKERLAAGVADSIVMFGHHDDPVWSFMEMGRHLRRCDSHRCISHRNELGPWCA